MTGISNSPVNPTSSFAYSEESEPEKMAADVMSLLILCKGYAQDNEVDQTAMNSYQLTCIKDEDVH